MLSYTDDPMHGLGFPLDARPSIQSNHIDGPVLFFRDGQMHWLNWRERFLLAIGFTDAEKLERKRRPNLMRRIDPLTKRKPASPERPAGK